MLVNANLYFDCSMLAHVFWIFIFYDPVGSS